MQTPDPVLKGTVLVNLPSARKITRFQVLLEGLCDVARKFSKKLLDSLRSLTSLFFHTAGAGHNAYETSTTLRKELVTEFHGEEFDVNSQLHLPSFRSRADSMCR